MEEYLPLTRKYHMIVTSVDIPLKTMERMLDAASEMYEDANEHVISSIHSFLANKLRQQVRMSFQPGRKYKVEISSEPVPARAESLTTTYSLAAYIYLANPEEANIDEVVHPNVFSSSIEVDELIETNSEKTFKPYFDNLLMQIMPVINQDMALKYFVRVK